MTTTDAEELVSAACEDGAVAERFGALALTECRTLFGELALRS